MRDKVKAFRAALGITQNDLAREIQAHPSTVARWESGSTQPKAQHLEKMIRLAKKNGIDFDPFAEEVEMVERSTSAIVSS